MSPMLILAITMGLADPTPKKIDSEEALNAYRKQDVTPKTNANVLLWQALGPMHVNDAMPDGYFKALGMKPPAVGGKYFISAFQYAKNVLKMDEKGVDSFMLNVYQAGQTPWDERTYPDVAKWLKINADALTLMTQACQRPGYYNPVIAPRTKKGDIAMLEVEVENVQRCRYPFAALLARAMLNTTRKESTDAWADLLTAQRLARHVATRGLLIELLIGTSLEMQAVETSLLYLMMSNPDAKMLRSHLRDLDKLPKVTQLAESMDRIERFTFQSLVEIVKNGGPSALSNPLKEPEIGDNFAMLFMDWPTVHAEMDSWFDRAAATLDHPTYPDQLAATQKFIEEVRAIETKLPKNESAIKDNRTSKLLGRILVKMMLPAYHKIAEAQTKAQQWHDNLRLALTLTLYYQENERFPKTLKEMVPKYLAEVPVDRFTGKPLKYRPAKVGYIAYSFGPNLKDDEGHGKVGFNPSDDIPIHILPPNAAEFDGLGELDESGK